MSNRMQETMYNIVCLLAMLVLAYTICDCRIIHYMALVIVSAIMK